MVKITAFVMAENKKGYKQSLSSQAMAREEKGYIQAL